MSATNSIELENNLGLLMLEDSEGVLGMEAYTNSLFLRVVQQTGEPPYGLDETPGTNFQVPGNDDPGLPYENEVVPKTGPLK